MISPDQQTREERGTSPQATFAVRPLVVCFAFTLIGIGVLLSMSKAPNVLFSTLPVTGVASTPKIGAEIGPLQSAPIAPHGELIVIHVEVQDILDHAVVQSGWEVPVSEVIGQFELAAQMQNIGLIAHNHLVGGDFLRLRPDMLVRVTMADESIQLFEIYSLTSYQASNPYDFTQSFVDLATGDFLHPVDLFHRMYRPNELTLQTCIEIDGLPTWGVFFVQAKVFDPLD